MDAYTLMKLMKERSHGDSMSERYRGMFENRDREDFYPEDMFSRSRRRREMDFDEDEMTMFHKLKKMFHSMDDRDKKEFWEALMETHEGRDGKHFSPSYAKFEVSDMYHTENGNKHLGEKYTMDKAEEILKRYKSLLPEGTTTADVYVAINHHFHKYAQLFKAWFGDNTDTKIIESALIFWFKDEEFPEGGKIWKHFKMMK